MNALVISNTSTTDKEQAEHDALIKHMALDGQTIVVIVRLPKKAIKQPDFTILPRYFNYSAKKDADELRARYNRYMIAVEGYENTPKGLMEIPEVVRYLKYIAKKYPDFMYYLKINANSDLIPCFPFFGMITMSQISISNNKCDVAGHYATDYDQAEFATAYMYHIWHMIETMRSINMPESVIKNRCNALSVYAESFLSEELIEVVRKHGYFRKDEE